MLEFIIKFVCIVGLPLFFIVGFLYPLITGWLYSYFDVEYRSLGRAARRRRMLRKKR